MSFKRVNIEQVGRLECTATGGYEELAFAQSSRTLRQRRERIKKIKLRNEIMCMYRSFLRELMLVLLFFFSGTPAYSLIL